MDNHHTIDVNGVPQQTVSPNIQSLDHRVTLNVAHALASWFGQRSYDGKDISIVALAALAASHMHGCQLGCTFSVIRRLDHQSFSQNIHHNTAHFSARWISHMF